MVSRILSLIVCEHFDNEYIIKSGEEVTNFYMIKKGNVILFDNKYNYMYDLEPGSFFGEYNILFGLISNVYYRSVS